MVFERGYRHVFYVTVRRRCDTLEWCKSNRIKLRDTNIECQFLELVNHFRAVEMHRNARVVSDFRTLSSLPRAWNGGGSETVAWLWRLHPKIPRNKRIIPVELPPRIDGIVPITVFAPRRVRNTHAVSMHHRNVQRANPF